MASSKYVVVGVDGSHDGLRAVEYAAHEAVARGQRLLLVHAYDLAPAATPALPWYGMDARRRFGVHAIEAAHRRALAVAPGQAVDQALVRTTPTRAIVNASRCASMVVLGRHHRHGALPLFSGSISVAVAAKAKVPVLTIPDDWTPDGSQAAIVVGTDGSDAAHDALRFAFEAAQARRAPLVVVRVWETPLDWHEQIEALDDAVLDWREQAERELAEALAGWAADYPDVAVSRQVERGRWAAVVLVGVAAGAGLLVVGARGSGGIRGLDIGGTARSALAHAVCPVVVVHRDDMRSGLLAA
jgi:nucleotide-binding universal stress UspA family protein